MIHKHHWILTILPLFFNLAFASAFASASCCWTFNNSAFADRSIIICELMTPSLFCMSTSKNSTEVSSDKMVNRFDSPRLPSSPGVSSTDSPSPGRPAEDRLDGAIIDLYRSHIHANTYMTWRYINWNHCPSDHCVGLTKYGTCTLIY